MILAKMLSRHFYEINEVCYALLQSLRKGTVDESIFWARELILSEEYDLFQKTIIQAWILWLGARNIHWLEYWTKCDDDDYLQKCVLVAEFCVLRKSMNKNSMRPCLYPFIICSRGVTNDYNEEKIIEAIETSNPFQLYYNLGIDYVNSPSAATEYISGLVEDVINPIVDVMKTLKQVKLKMLLAACACQVACLKIYPSELVIVNNDYVSSLLQNWECFVNRRKGRLFKIVDADMPHGKKRLTQEEALFISYKEIRENGCAYWKRQTECDDLLMPDDIPDEWSYEDRAISHPVKSNKYTIYYRPEYRFKQIWGFVPFIKRTWLQNLDSFWNICSCPSI